MSLSRCVCLAVFVVSLATIIAHSIAFYRHSLIPRRWLAAMTGTAITYQQYKILDKTYGASAPEPKPVFTDPTGGELLA